LHLSGDPDPTTPLPSQSDTGPNRSYTLAQYANDVRLSGGACKLAQSAQFPKTDGNSRRRAAPLPIGKDAVDKIRACAYQLHARHQGPRRRRSQKAQTHQVRTWWNGRHKGLKIPSGMHVTSHLPLFLSPPVNPFERSGFPGRFFFPFIHETFHALSAPPALVTHSVSNR